MQPLPHHYNVTVTAGETGQARISSAGLSSLASAPPAEFGGPGDLWSPETLAMAAVADCLVFTFRAISAASKLQWTNFVCEAKGTVDRVEGVTRFTEIRLHGNLVVANRADVERAHKLLEKAEKNCLIGNSFKCTPILDVAVNVGEPALAPTA